MLERCRVLKDSSPQKKHGFTIGGYSTGLSIHIQYIEAGARDFHHLLRMWPRLLSKENGRIIEPKETLSCLIPLLLVVSTRQLEILVTSLSVKSSSQ